MSNTIIIGLKGYEAKNIGLKHYNALCLYNMRWINDNVHLFRRKENQDN